MVVPLSLLYTVLSCFVDALCRYNPTTDLEIGLKHFVKWYKSYYMEGSGHENSLNGYKPY